MALNNPASLTVRLKVMVIMNGHETVGCHLAVKPIVQQTVRHEEPMAWGTSSRDPPV